MYFINDKPAAIRNVQSMLRTVSQTDDDFTHVPRDGVYGKETRDAVALFQKKKRLAPTGEVNYETFSALVNACRPAHRHSDVPVPSVTLKRGDCNPDVRKLHENLRIWNGISKNPVRVPASDYYSEETEAAVRSVERAFCEEETGEMSPALYGKLLTYILRATETKTLYPTD